MSRLRQHNWRLVGAAALTLVVVLAALWQAEARASQHIPVGDLFDDGYANRFYAREQAGPPAAFTFRWARPDQSFLRFWPVSPGAPAILTLQLTLPGTAANPRPSQRLALGANGRPLGELDVDSSLRRYSLVLNNGSTTVDRGSGGLSLPLNLGSAAEVRVELRSPRFVSADVRRLGVVVADAQLRQPERSPAGLLWELLLAPALPTTLLLGALGMAQLRRGPLAAAVVGAGLLTLVLAAEAAWGQGLLVAWFALAAVLLLLAALAIDRLLRARRPVLSDRHATAALAIVFLVVLALTFSPALLSDGVGYYAYLRSLALDGDLHFENEYLRLYGSIPFDPGGMPYVPNPWSVGPALLWSPLFLLTHLLLTLGRVIGAPWEADGYADPYIAAVALVSALGALAFMLASYRTCRRWFPPGAAALAVTAIFLGSTLWHYAMRMGTFAHALSAATTALYLLALVRLRERPTLRRWVELGAAVGLMLLVYWISAWTLLALLVALPALAAGHGPARWAAARRALAGAAAAALVALAVFSPQMIVWQVMYGSPLTQPPGVATIAPGESRWLEMLVAPFGLIPWTPLMFAGVLGLLLLARHDRSLAAGLLLSFAAFFAYNSTIPDWHGDGAFGLRRLTLLAPWCALGLAAIFAWLHERRLRFVSLFLTLAGALWGLSLLIRYDLFFEQRTPLGLLRQPWQDIYLSMNTIPAWDIGRYLLGGYLLDLLRELRGPADLAYLSAIVLAGAAGSWALHALSARQER